MGTDFTLEFNRVGDTQYVVLDYLTKIMGNIIRDSHGDWIFFVDKRNIILTQFELEQLITKIKDLKHEAKIQVSPKG